MFFNQACMPHLFRNPKNCEQINVFKKFVSRLVSTLMTVAARQQQDEADLAAAWMHCCVHQE